MERQHAHASIQGVAADTRVLYSIMDTKHVAKWMKCNWSVSRDLCQPRFGLEFSLEWLLE